MSDFRGKPSGWLLKNSNGFPDFLFTILTYSMVLLGFVTLMWVTFGVLGYLNSDPVKAEMILQIMDSLKTGLISLAGVVFGLAGSYTIRRFKKDDHWIEKTKLEQEEEQKKAPVEAAAPVQEGLRLVYNEEDI
ncbi:MAG: hypothetical protein HUU32_08580 [Calditrichaceae bacterium]|nr:hypothetical protein [Calditrichia bacterium]NUQ41433.1 hypothetical protein [Calditrichaceae bacterium]